MQGSKTFKLISDRFVEIAWICLEPMVSCLKKSRVCLCLKGFESCMLRYSEVWRTSSKGKWYFGFELGGIVWNPCHSFKRICLFDDRYRLAYESWVSSKLNCHILCAFVEEIGWRLLDTKCHFLFCASKQFLPVMNSIFWFHWCCEQVMLGHIGGLWYRVVRSWCSRLSYLGCVRFLILRGYMEKHYGFCFQLFWFSLFAIGLCRRGMTSADL